MNKNCDDFKLSELSANNFKCLIFVQRFVSAKDAEIRCRVLNKLGNGLNLIHHQIVEDSQRFVSVRQDTKNIEESGIAHIRKVRQKKKNLLLPLNQTNTKRNKTNCHLTRVPVVGHYIGILIDLNGIRSA